MKKTITEEDKENKPEIQQAPFNAAVACLMRLDEILKDIKNNDANINLSSGLLQAQKMKLVRAFYVQSIALIKEKENKEAIKKAILSLNLSYGEKYKGCNPEDIVIIYTPKLDIELDNILIMIQEALQETGYYMPTAKSDIL